MVSERKATIVPGAEALLLEVGPARDRGVDPLDDGVMAALELSQGVAARSGDLERLEEAVELEALAHAHRHQREHDLELMPVLAQRHGLDLAAAGRQLGGEAERLRQGPAEHARRGPAEQLLGRRAPARDRPVAVGEHEAGVDQLSEQLLYDLGGRGH